MGEKGGENNPVFSNIQLCKVDSYYPNGSVLRADRSRLASPISEMTEDRSHLSGHEADDEMIDHRGHKKHYRTRKERSLLTKEELKYIHQRPNSSFHRPKTAESKTSQLTSVLLFFSSKYQFMLCSNYLLKIIIIMTTASYCLIVSLKCEQNDYEKSATCYPLSLFFYIC